MGAEDGTTWKIASVRNNNTNLCKLLRSYLEVVSYLMEKSATKQAIAEYDTENVRYM